MNWTLSFILPVGHQDKSSRLRYTHQTTTDLRVFISYLQHHWNSLRTSILHRAIKSCCKGRFAQHYPALVHIRKHSAARKQTWESEQDVIMLAQWQLFQFPQQGLVSTVARKESKWFLTCSLGGGCVWKERTEIQWDSQQGSVTCRLAVFKEKGYL